MAEQNGRVGEQVSGEIRIGEFITDLAQLRREAGQPSLRKMAETAHYSHTALSSVLSGTRLPSLELTVAFVRACGGDEGAWRARWHREVALTKGTEPADPQPTPERPTVQQPRASRGALFATAGLTVLVAVSIVVLVTGSGPRTNRQVDQPAGASVSAPDASVPDGADPQEERCQLDALSEQTVSVPDPDPAQPGYGSLTLRYSPRCRAAWPLFVSTERVPTGATVRLYATRPSDGAVSRFDYPFMVQRQVYSVFGNVLRTTRGCVSVTVEISAADNRSLLASARTPCVQLGAET